MANFQDQNWSDYRELLSWIVVVIFLATIWPVGVFLLLRKLLRGSHRRNRRYAGGAWWGNAAPARSFRASRARQRLAASAP